MHLSSSSVFVVSSFCVILFPLLFYTSFGELDDSTLYPIIINTDGDKAVFILPELGCHVVQDFRFDFTILEMFIIFLSHATLAKPLIRPLHRLINRIISKRNQQPNVY